MNKKTTEAPSQNKSFEKFLKTNPKLGLNDSQVLNRQKIFGFNELKKSRSKSFASIYFGQLKDLMALLLLFAGIAALGLALWFQLGKGQDQTLTFVQAAIIIAIVILNALFGAIQEQKSSTAIEQLQKLSAHKCKVFRDKTLMIIDSKNLVIGDIIVVEAGDFISADARLIESSSLKCVESALTGESLPVDKDHELISSLKDPIGDRMDWIFSGCSVINGRATAIVERIGNQTEIGKVAQLLSDKDSMKTPLQLKLTQLGKYLGIFGIILTVLSFIFSIFVVEGLAFDLANDNFNTFTDTFPPSLILAISLATAAIPEGLGTVVNIILSIGVKRMSEKNGLIKKLPAVETLGSTAVICSDKTGTLTLNKMKVVQLWTPNSSAHTVPKGKLNPEEENFIKYATLCTDCVIEEDKDKKRTVIGDPTEIAIVELALDKGFDDDKWDADHIRLGDIPFDSNRKMMTSINKIQGKQIVIVKGAPDVVFEKCKDFKNKEQARKIYNEWSDKAIRVLAVAYREYDKPLPEELESEEFEKDLIFMGLIGMIDPPREEVKQSIKQCISAGIKPVMITGDHLNTAVAIARNLGIYKKGDLAITGVQLDKISDQDLKKTIHKYSVFARVSPENKIRIVKAWQSIDQVVAMTGDGVNDAPALQAADIGCAMGITGTDVSKGAADMVLTDDNFATIVASVRSGRGIYENIRKVIKFLLSSNLGSIISIVLGMIIFYFVFNPTMAGWGASNVLLDNWLTIDESKIVNDSINKAINFQTTITTIQILLTNIVIETIPGIALGTQRTTNDLMKVRPRSKFETVFADGLIQKIILSGVVSGISTIIAFVLGTYFAIATGVPGLRFYYGTTAAFVALSLGGVFKSISISSNKSVFKTAFKNNKWVYIACIPSILIISFAVLIPQVSYVFAEAVSIQDLQSHFGRTIFISNPELVDKFTNNDLFDVINKNLFNYKTNNNIVNMEVISIAVLFSFLPFITLELDKLYEHYFKGKKVEQDITEFKIVPRPKNNFSNKFKWLR